MAIAHRVTPEAEPVLTKETAFHPRWSQLTRNVTEYRGYWLPTCFTNEGAVAEYWACREKAAVMDLSPLRKWEILGPDAERLMQHTVTRDVRRLADGQVVYTALCNETGGMLDDATVFRLGADNFRFVGGDEYDGVHLKQLAERLGLRVWVKPTTDELHNVAVQGPLSRDILREIIWAAPTQPQLEELRWFRFLIGRIGGYQGMPVVVSRTGYSGELGYEIFCHPSDGPAVWDAVWKAGAPRGMKPLGLDALDMLRIESGLIFAGYEFDDQVDPVRGGHRLHRGARHRGRLPGQGRARGAQGAPAAPARRARARGIGDGRPRRLRARGPLAGRRHHLRDPLPHAAQEHRAVPHGGPVRGARHGGRGRQARRAPEADPGDRRAGPVLRPGEEAPALLAVTVRIDPAAPAAWARSGATTVLVRSPAGTRRVIRALNAGAERLFAAVVDPDDGWQPMQGVERAVATPAGVELRVHASDLSDAQAQALAEAIADILRAAGVREALVTLPEGAPREPAPAPAHVGAAAEAYAEEAWARAAALLEPPPGARPLTVVALRARRR